MRKSRKIPWNRRWLQLSPEEYEVHVKERLEKLGLGLAGFRAEHRERLNTSDGEFEIDATVRFEALGVDFLVLVECKHQKNPIKRDVVQILRDRVRAAGAQKAILFSTSRFQSGAREYAEKHRIALVHLVPGLEPHMESRSVGPELWVEPAYEGVDSWSVTPKTYSSFNQDHLLEVWAVPQAATA